MISKKRMLLIATFLMGLLLAVVCLFVRGFSRVTPQPKEHASVPNPPLASLPNLGAQSSEFYQKHPEKPQDFCLYMRDLLADSCKRKQVWACQRLVDQESNDAHQKLRRREALREALVEKCENGGDGSACHDLLRRGDVASEEEKERLRKKYDAWRLDVSCLQDKDYDECFKVFPKNPASPDEWQTQQKILQVMQTDCQEHGNPEACAWMYGFASVPGKEEFWRKQLLSNYEEKCFGQNGVRPWTGQIWGNVDRVGWPQAEGIRSKRRQSTWEKYEEALPWSSNKPWSPKCSQGN